jgi:threonine/homoserine/homoserine lactone efflux protein
MEVILPLLFGFAASFTTTLLPGLLNMTAAKVSLKENRRNALIFSAGASLVVFFQAYIAVTFSKLINSRPDIVYLLEEVGVLVFFILTVYFLFLSKKKKPKAADDIIKIRSRTGNFFLGVALSALNFFPIPFYVFVSISLSALNIFFFTNLYIFLFVIGALGGSFLVFYLYIIFFKRFEHRTEFVMRNVNYFIGTITGLITVVTLLRIWKNHY